MMSDQDWQVDGVHVPIHRPDYVVPATYGSPSISRDTHVDYSKPPVSRINDSSNKGRSYYTNDPLISENEESAESNEDKSNILRQTAIKLGSTPTHVIRSRFIFKDSHPIGILIGLLDAQRSLIAKIVVDSFNSETLVTPYFVVDCLSRNYDRDLAIAELRRQEMRHQHDGGCWKLCSQLKHYKHPNPRQRGPVSEAQILCFSDRQFSTSHLPAGFPAELSDMKLEANRLKSFALAGRPAFHELCKTGPRPQELAANGFFYMQEGDRVKCAFCLGTLFNWESGDVVEQAHSLRFSTCPMLLGLDVGNVPVPKSPQDIKLSQACSDSQDQTAEPPAARSWAPPRGVGARHPELDESAAQLSRRPRPPVSSAAAAAALRPGAEDNLELLSRSLRNRETAALYHPERHPAWRDQRRREEALARSSQPVPADQLASAGFFLDSELRTSCYWCGLQLVNWLVADDPWIEHARWSPRCCHLLLERGSDFVLASRASHPPYQLPSPLDAGASGLASEAKAAAAAAGPPEMAFVSGSGGSGHLIDYRIEPRYFKAREDFHPALSALQLGCDPDDVKTAQHLQLKGSGDDFASDELFLQSVLAQHRRRERLGLGGREFYEQSLREQELARNREPRQFEGDELDWSACKVCMDKVINVTLLDCKHLCCCSTCAKNLDTCPLCRAPIRATMLINMD